MKVTRLMCTDKGEQCVLEIGLYDYDANHEALSEAIKSAFGLGTVRCFQISQDRPDYVMRCESFGSSAVANVTVREERDTHSAQADIEMIATEGEAVRFLEKIVKVSRAEIDKDYVGKYNQLVAQFSNKSQ